MIFIKDKNKVTRSKKSGKLVGKPGPDRKKEEEVWIFSKMGQKIIRYVQKWICTHEC